MGAIPELVKNGEKGFLVQPGDHTRLAERILELSHNKKLDKKWGTKPPINNRKI